MNNALEEENDEDEAVRRNYAKHTKGTLSMAQSTRSMPIIPVNNSMWLISGKLERENG